MKNMINIKDQIKKLSDDDLILFDLIINVWCFSEFESILKSQKINFIIPEDFDLTDFNNTKILSKIHLKLRQIENV